MQNQFVSVTCLCFASLVNQIHAKQSQRFLQEDASTLGEPEITSEFNVFAALGITIGGGVGLLALVHFGGKCI